MLEGMSVAVLEVEISSLLMLSLCLASSSTKEVTRASPGSEDNDEEKTVENKTVALSISRKK